MDEQPEAKRYGCTACWCALTPSETWVIDRGNGNRLYRCEKHRTDAGRPVTGWLGASPK